MQPKKRQRLKVKRKAIKIVGDTSRVITLLHLPDDRSRISKIIQRIMSLSETAAKNLITQIMIDFAGRHEDIEHIFERHLNEVKGYLPRDAMLSDAKRALIGAYFTKSTPLNQPPFSTLPSSPILIKAIWTKAACALS